MKPMIRIARISAEKILIYFNRTLATIPFSSTNLALTRQVYAFKKRRYSSKRFWNTYGCFHEYEES